MIFLNYPFKTQSSFNILFIHFKCVFSLKDILRKLYIYLYNISFFKNVLFKVIYKDKKPYYFIVF